MVVFDTADGGIKPKIRLQETNAGSIMIAIGDGDDWIELGAVGESSSSDPIEDGNDDSSDDTGNVTEQGIEIMMDGTSQGTAQTLNFGSGLTAEVLDSVARISSQIEELDDHVRSPDVERIFMRETDPAEEFDDITEGEDLWIDTSESESAG